MASSAGGVVVKGVRELQRAFRKIDRDAEKEFTKALKKAGEPTRRDAESLAGSNIRNVTVTWSRIRLGARRGEVYIAPRARRRGGSPRPNFGKLLLVEAMEPAVEKNADRIRNHLEDALDMLGRKAGF